MRAYIPLNFKSKYTRMPLQCQRPPGRPEIRPPVLRTANGGLMYMAAKEPDDFVGLLALPPFEKERESGLGLFHDPIGRTDRPVPRCPPDNATGLGKDRTQLIPASTDTSVRIALSVAVHGVKKPWEQGLFSCLAG